MLKDSLLKYSKEVYPMHMPGHKGGRIKLVEDVYAVDVTEVPDTDHLYRAEGIIKESLEGIQEFYQTKKSMYLVNGSTVGVLSSIAGLHKLGDHILVARNCHQSVYNAIKLNNLYPHYVYPKITQFGLVGGIKSNEVKKVLVANPEIVSFVMTSPTYDGFVSDIKAIAEVCHRYNVLLIVDEAHGAHFSYASIFPESAITLGADIVIHSTHKTLPTITGSGLLHMNLDDELEEKVLSALNQYQTSSPSYVMMAQIDQCVQTFGNNEPLWIRYEQILDDVNKTLKKMKHLFALTTYINEEEGIIALDPLKSVIITRGINSNGLELIKKFRTEYKIQMEMASFSHMLGIFSIADAKKDLLKYAKALVKLDKKVKKKNKKVMSTNLPKGSCMKYTPYEINHYHTKKVKLEDSVDTISAVMITPYPPGIPAVVPGELITKQMVEHLQQWLNHSIDVLGVHDGMIQIVVEE